MDATIGKAMGKPVAPADCIVNSKGGRHEK
jgi:hypothetical protein